MTDMVYLPGASGSRGFWRPVAERLADVGPATILGWPGFGDEPADETVHSVADLVRWTLARLPSAPCDVVAQSMGGVVATLLALAHPARVRRLVLCATSGGIDVAALGAANWRPEYSAEFPHVPNWFVVDRTDLSARLPAIAAPTLVLYGDQDPLCNQSIASYLAGQIPRTRLACIRGGSHMMARNQPDAIAPIDCAPLLCAPAALPAPLVLPPVPVLPPVAPPVSLVPPPLPPAPHPFPQWHPRFHPRQRCCRWRYPASRRPAWAHRRRFRHRCIAQSRDRRPR